jgi:hypothetical protein
VTEQVGDEKTRERFDEWFKLSALVGGEPAGLPRRWTAHTEDAPSIRSYAAPLGWLRFGPFSVQLGGQGVEVFGVGDGKGGEHGGPVSMPSMDAPGNAGRLPSKGRRPG